jgi:hypothetical protein
MASRPTRLAPVTPALVEIHVQKNLSDCAVASLAMISGRPYRVVSEAAVAAAPTVHTRGLWTTQILAIAKAIKFPLRRVKHPLDDDTGLVIVKDATGKTNDCHVAALFQGVLIDPATGNVWDFDTYLHTQQWVVIGFLRA